MKITTTSKITVKSIQTMGGDHMVVAAAKVSTSPEDALQWSDPQNAEAGAGLINYLVKMKHGTPFEHAAMTLFVHAPICVWREWHRHRIGFCLAGDTLIYTESYGAKSGRTIRQRRIKDMYDLWVNGVKDTMGRVRFLPSIKNVRLRVLNEDTGFFELGAIKDIVQSGFKECLLVETIHKKNHAIRCSKDHPILTSEGWVKAGELSGNELIAVSGKRSEYEGRQIPPSLRAGIGVWTSMQRSLLIPKDGANCYVCDKPYHFHSLVLNHVVPVAEDLKLALDTSNLKPCCLGCHREKTNSEQTLARRSNVAGVRFVPLARKPYVISEEMTYDISMEGPHHNFVANGMVVHNSYNEESARYKQLDPVFYIPAQDRPMIPVEGFKSARPGFRLATDEEYTELVEVQSASYQQSYDAYAVLLGDNPKQPRFDRGMARNILPVGIFSSCWVTCNPRSLMAFLSLRTHDDDAKHVSFPLWEIEIAARAAEEILAEGWPITYAAFCKNGRVAP